MILDFSLLNLRTGNNYVLTYMAVRLQQEYTELLAQALAQTVSPTWTSHP